MFKLRVVILSMILFLGGLLFFSETTSATSYIVNPNKTYTYSNMTTDITKLKKAYPGLIDTKVIGTTEYGRKIYAVSLGKGDSTVFFNGSHHAREWITTNLNMNMIDKYAYAYQNNTTINGYKVRTLLNNTKIWFVPMVNPDGVTLQLSGLKDFPKTAHKNLIKMNNGSTNFKRWKANGMGVDLNRQYNANWSQLSGPKSPSFKNYKGKAAATAKETKAVIAFVNGINPEMAISYHSSGEILFWNYQQSGARYTRDYGYAKKLGKITGYSLVYPKSFGGGGGFSDWFSRIKKKPAYTLELAPFAGETNVPVKAFSKIWRENSSVGLYIAQEGFKLYDTRNTTASKDLVKKIQSYTTKTASKLQKYYETDITSVKNLVVSTTLSNQYKKVTDEIKKQEKEIANLPAKYRTNPNTTLKKTKLYQSRALAFMNGIQAGDSLLANNKTVNAAFKAGTINSKTISSYQSLVKNLSSTKTTLAKMENSRVRSLGSTKYIVPVQDFTDSASFEIKRYQLMKTMEEQIKTKQYSKARENMNKLQTLNSQSVAFKRKAPGRYITFAATEKSLTAMQAKIEKALTEAELTTSSTNLEKKIQTYTTETASKLQQYYETDIKLVSHLIVTNNLSNTYKNVTDEIKKQEKEIAKLPTQYRSKPNTALGKTKLYQSNALAFMNGIQAGDSLLANNNTIIAAFEAGTINSATISSYQSLVENITSTKTTLAKMENSRVRELALTKYITPVQDFTDSAEFEIERYKLMKTMEEQIKAKQYSEARENMNKLQTLITQSEAFKLKDPDRYKTFNATEKLLADMQAELEKVLK